MATSTNNLIGPSVVLTGNITFDAETKTIVRSTGSWITDGVVVGKTLLTFSGTTSNNKSVHVKLVDATTITIQDNEVITDEVATTATTSAYYSDLLYTDQFLSTPKVNINKVWYSVSSSGDVTVTRNSVPVLKLFGHDTIEQFGLAENNTSDIVVTFNTSAGGTIILDISKLEGFTYPSSWTVSGEK